MRRLSMLLPLGRTLAFYQLVARQRKRYGSRRLLLPAQRRTRAHASFARRVSERPLFPVERSQNGDCSMNPIALGGTAVFDAPAYVRHDALREWVQHVSTLTKPERVVWCDASQQEYFELCAQIV